MSRGNNFDCIRLVAAVTVLVSHSFLLTGMPPHVEPFRQWLGNYDSGGEIGVAIFFVISGYLVSASVCRRSTADYLISRALRIVPALVLVSCFDVFVIGPVFTTRPLLAYFSDLSTWSHLANPTIFRINLYLPGVFESLPDHGANGSLWTLPVECGLYLILPAVAFCGGLTKRGTAVMFAACVISYFVATGYFGLNNWSARGPFLFQGVMAFDAFKLSAFFFAGAALQAYRNNIPLHAGGAIVCGLILFAATETVTAPAAYFLCLPYLVIFAALKTPTVSLRFGDISYGVYLFAFPIQQGIVSILGTGHPIRLSAIALPFVLMCAVASWWLVEKPALRWRQKRPEATVIPLTAAA
jgi:peptidoglycan/LPS O-acetylase OafA/YrhL